MVKVQNISGGPLVCSLNSGDTLRLDNRSFTTIKDNEITTYLRNIEKKGYVKITNVTKGKNDDTTVINK